MTFRFIFFKFSIRVHKSKIPNNGVKWQIQGKNYGGMQYDFFHQAGINNEISKRTNRSMRLKDAFRIKDEPLEEHNIIQRNKFFKRGK